MDPIVDIPGPIIMSDEALTTEEMSHLVFNEGIIVVFIMLMIYMGFEAFKHKHELAFGHEASLVTLLGFFISWCFMKAGTADFAQMFQFQDDLFFYFVLPPIIFASGFNMQRKKFFQNFTNIILLGLVGTIIAFTTFSALTILFRNLMTINQYDGATGEWSTLNLTDIEILIMCSLLCSTDVIAAVSLLNAKTQPKLFSLVFGEGITNDAVSIILFNTVVNFAKENEKLNFKSTMEIAGEFTALGFNSILLGIVIGLACSYMLKSVRALTKTPVSECAMIFVFAYVSYIVAELCAVSGIIALLTCAVFQANYAWYNLSPQGKQSSVVIFQFIGYLAEGFVFAYLGLTFFSYQTYMWSSDLILIEFFIILVGRGMGTFGLIGLLKLCGYEEHSKHKISWKELMFIWYAGLIRGAIAFGLVLRIEDNVVNRSVIVTTCLTLVVVSTILFGSTVGLLGKCLFSEAEKQDGEDVSQVEESEDDVSYDLSELSGKENQLNAPLVHYNEEK